MPMDDRKQRILTAIVALYATGGEPVGSHLLSRHFDMAVSSATLRNEMAALTKLGLLEQPHTSAGRVPTARGYRYYVDSLMAVMPAAAQAQRAEMDEIFHELDHDPEKLAQGAARAFSDYLGYAVIISTPRAEDMSIAHYEVIQVGRFTAAVLGVTAAGGVRTRVAKMDNELGEGDTRRVAATLNRMLRFVAEADVTQDLARDMVNELGGNKSPLLPILSAALTLLSEVGRPSVYLEGQQHFLRWPELEPDLRPLIELLNDPRRLESLIRPQSAHITVLFGDELPEKPIPGLCFLSKQYLAGGGLAGAIAVAGPTRMRFSDVLPKLDYMSDLLGRGMSGAA